MSEELKAGHAPAVKAGGKRVVSKHKLPEKPDSDAYDQKYIDQLPENPSSISAPVSAPVSPPKKPSEGPSDAIKIAHSKPQPTVEKAHSPSKVKHINQPRKF